MSAVDLVTGALVLVAATAALAGPVTAAMLMRRHGAALSGTAPAWSLGLALVATVLTSGTAAALLVMAWRRARPRSRAVGSDRAVVRVASERRLAAGYPPRELADRGVR
ncbi:hypothetical protein GV791_24020 [Nocardia cyriacigeorgica]|uniref:Uncharacterized protein n=1 Tax=Nocardia cyriacigeorgica TaxID=135487 RepID=A0A6P1CST8_9NOCA|nr:hypothetical protein [Nocardia cyriacigeorgica]MBF6080240.1 hypothetical protein [Nocardia cyriacigeorgica]MBF6289764.1 hypothetical protein [Nocardia cyriacigeorgica]MBF6428618.1 hypothetical protein [Nocardia cyriacigeorgica]NEW35611.1 hypothetical protein [Nocardia cyriacigeorgica]BDU06849.1 hypothetical protein FMUBM48_31120 [Nocardia cyriacigeorgica]